ncbi:mechanosensitive ion channel domain-containing protein [Candidatus Uabimicrobium sp. HlEnr_7]|uniref:mechanosensitive ion channel domain-containing protein n=1 Tax=Candidatus Uabimicrobium helgolandensis TaxID=3095367 RepID=UPI0035572C23
MNKKILIIATIISILPIMLYTQENLASLDNKSLLDTANKIDISLQNPLKILNESRDILTTLEASLKSTLEQLDKTSHQESQQPVTPSNIKEKIESLVDLQKRVQEKQSLREETTSQLKKYETQLEETKKRAKTVIHLLQEFEQLLKEIELRITTKSIAPKNLPKNLIEKKAQSVTEQKKRIETSIILWESKKQKIPTRIEAIKKNIKIGQKQQQQLREKKHLYEKQQLTYRKKAEIRQELEKHSPETLLALLSSTAPVITNKAKDLEKKINDISEKNTKLKQLQQDDTPDNKKIEIQSKIPSTIEAEKRWKSTQVILNHKKSQFDKSKSSSTVINDLIKETQDLTKEFNQHYDSILRLDVIVENLTATQQKLSDLPIEEYKKLISKQTQKRQTILSYGKQIDLWQKQGQEVEAKTKKISSELEKINEEVTQLKKAYEEEQKWEKWVIDVDKLSEKQLNNKLTLYLKNAKDTQKKIQEFDQTAKTLNMLLQTQKQIIHDIQSPLVIYSQQALEDLYQQATRSVEQIANEKKYEISLRLDRNVSNENLKKYLKQLTIIARGFPKEISEEELQRLEQQLDFFSNVLTVAQEKESAQKKLQQILGDIYQQRQLQISQMKERMLTLRKAYGAATEFQIRLGKKEILSVPESIKNVPSKGDLLVVEKEIQTLEQNYNATKKIIEQQKRNMEIFHQKTKYIETRISTILEKLKYLQKRQKLSKNYDKKELTNTEEQQYQQAIYEKKIANSDWWINMLSFFGSKEAKQQEKLLDSYFADLVTLERKIKNLEKRGQINQSLIKISNEERKILKEQTLPSPQKKINTHLSEIEAKLKPSSFRQDILNSFFPEETSKISLPQTLSNEQRQEYLPKAVDEVFRNWIASLTYLAQKNAIEYETSKLGLETESARYKEDIGRIESKKRQIIPEVSKLTGHSQKSLYSLDPIEKPQNKEQQSRYLQGEISHTRHLQAQALLHSAFISIMSLIFIPIIALLLIRTLNRVGKNLIYKVTASSYNNNKVREQRAQTLLSTLQTTWTAVVFVIAGIYMLKQFRIDITPIIASAGVLGLALAFGAQTLVRDYISGFFILLENQYVTGDMVEIDGITGCVIKITLRLTIVRALDGTVHFFPNGTFHHISNKSKNSRAVINIGTAYNIPVDKVLEILNQVAIDMRQDPKVGPMVLDDYEIQGLDSFDSSSINYRMWLKTTPGDQWTVKRATQRRIKIYFDKHNIEIPFPQRVLYNPKELSQEQQEQHLLTVEKTFEEAKTQLATPQEIQKQQEALIQEKQKQQVEPEDDNIYEEIHSTDSSDNDEIDEEDEENEEKKASSTNNLKTKKRKRKKKKKR